MFGSTSGYWWLESKSDPRWNANGSSEYIGGFVMCEEAEEALAQMKKKYKENPPKDLTHGYMKD